MCSKSGSRRAATSTRTRPRIRPRLEVLRKEKLEALLVERRKRVERNPTDLQLRFELGELLLSIGQFNEAIPELQQLARQNPNSRASGDEPLLGPLLRAKGNASTGRHANSRRCLPR